MKQQDVTVRCPCGEYHLFENCEADGEKPHRSLTFKCPINEDMVTVKEEPLGWVLQFHEENTRSITY